MECDTRRNSQPGNRLQAPSIGDESERRGSDSIIVVNTRSPKYFEMKVLNGGEKSSLLDNSVKIPIPQVSKLIADSKASSEKKRKVPKEETFCSIALEVLFPFLIAGMGMVGAGLVLNRVQHWPVFMELPETLILVPALLGLKGNLEMTLASRLSTQANLGNLDSRHAVWHMTKANLSLVQCQAIVVGFLASIGAFVLGWIQDGRFELNHALILCTSSIITASIASFTLGVVMVAVVLISRRFRINPDNVATPIACSLGDITTLSLLALISDFFYRVVESHQWLCPAIIFGYFVSMPVWIAIAKRYDLTRNVLYNGWTPVLSAMVISSCGGLILDLAVRKFDGIAVFQPVINGVGGNLVAVQASRISTSLHIDHQLGSLPEGAENVCSNPFQVFFARGGHARTARALLTVLIPGQLIFVYTILSIKADQTAVPSIFVLFYLVAAVIQVMILLYIAEVLVKSLWLHGIDPDNSAIPYLTAIGDLIGTGLLAKSFILMFLLGYPVDSDNNELLPSPE
ncbi:unnamed protein product [Orchesella dallaii]|uniref:SLC41A/MgtE integral membrane domain-containing protein n=1 Tax=Orchesella dallaii TaxID=48710 RepID=A0ABP1QBP9_9HEXA